MNYKDVIISEAKEPILLPFADLVHGDGPLPCAFESIYFLRAFGKVFHADTAVDPLAP